MLDSFLRDRVRANLTNYSKIEAMSIARTRGKTPRHCRSDYGIISTTPELPGQRKK